MIEIEIDRLGALLFDLDGTLVDTMPLHYAAYRDVLAARGLTLTQDTYMSLIGAPARHAIPRFVAAAGGSEPAPDDIAAIHREKKGLFAAVLSGRVEPLPAVRLLEAARGRLPIGLVTSGNREGATALLTEMKWLDVFDHVVTGDDVTHGKPHPEPYLAAASALAVEPGRCQVLEDSDDGVASARSAGMACIDVRRPWSFR